MGQPHTPRNKQTPQSLTFGLRSLGVTDCEVVVVGLVVFLLQRHRVVLVQRAVGARTRHEVNVVPLVGGGVGHVLNVERIFSSAVGTST